MINLQGKVSKSDDVQTGDNCRVIKNTISIAFELTCIGFQVFRGDHDYKSDGPFIAEHLVGPAADGAHAFDRSYAIVGY